MCQCLGCPDYLFINICFLSNLRQSHNQPYYIGKGSERGLRLKNEPLNYVDL
jgi:hypothetical protein